MYNVEYILFTKCFFVFFVFSKLQPIHDSNFIILLSTNLINLTVTFHPDRSCRH
jgi:hypothetical protein